MQIISIFHSTPDEFRYLVMNGMVDVEGYRRSFILEGSQNVQVGDGGDVWVVKQIGTDGGKLIRLNTLISEIHNVILSALRGHLLKGGFASGRGHFGDEGGNRGIGRSLLIKVRWTA